MKISFCAIATMLLLSATIATISSCKKDSSGSLQSVSHLDTVLTDTSIFIDFVLDGKRIFGIQKENAGIYEGGQEWGNFLTDTSIFNWNRIGSSFVNGNTKGLPYFAFTKGSINLSKSHYSDSTPGPVLYKAVDTFFQSGNYNYAVRTHDTTYNYYYNDAILDSSVTHSLLSSGITILWIDAMGKTWQTFDGTANQTGSYFTILKNEVIANPNAPGYTSINIITVQFACNLYDKAGNVMHITNGKFRLAQIY